MFSLYIFETLHFLNKKRITFYLNKIICQNNIILFPSRNWVIHEEWEKITEWESCRNISLNERDAPSHFLNIYLFDFLR